MNAGEDFKDTARTPDGMECTLDRLVRNIFEPVKIPVLVKSIETTLGKRPKEALLTYESSYQRLTRFVSRDGERVEGDQHRRWHCS